MDIPIISTIQYWYCPNCTQRSYTIEAQPHSRFHACAGLKGLTAPFVPEGQNVRVRAVEREDYVRKELVQLDGDGKAIMAVITDHEDGRHDVAVLAPTAQSSAQGNNL